MKKKLSIILVMTMVSGIVGCNVVASTSTTNTENTATYSQVVSGDTTLVGVRSVLESLGYDINWESTSKTIYASKKKNVIAITTDSDVAVLNGENVKMNTTATTSNGTLSISVASMEALTGEDISSDGTVVTTEETKDDSWKENKVDVNLSNISDDTYTINDAGVYTLSGEYEGMIYVNSTGRVKLILNGVTITNENGPAIFFEKSDKGIIESAEGTENTLTDGSEYNVDAKGCIFSNDDIDFQGNGVITVNGNYNHGIVSDDDIQIEEGTINVNTTVGDGIHANDGVEIKDGTINLNVMGDGISGDKYVEINDGSVNITTKGEVATSSNNDMPMGDFGGIQRDDVKNNQTMGERPEMPEGENMGEMPTPPEMSEGEAFGERPEKTMDTMTPPEMPEGQTMGEKPDGQMGDLNMGNFNKGNFNKENVTNVEGSTETTTEDESVSSKGIKSVSLITVNGGEININSTDHGVKCDGLVVINGGDIDITSEISKGIKAGGCFFINDGNINVDTKDESLESKASIVINGGDINVKSDDDGINAGGGSGAMMMNHVQDGDEHQIIINGGKVTVDAGGDGLDSNGNLYFYGGEVVIYGPTNGGNGSLDSGSANELYGGTLMALGSVGMVECPEAMSNQNVFNISLDEVQEANSSVVIMDSDNNTLYEAVAVKSFQNIIFSSDEIKSGKEYYVYINGEKAVTLTAESGVTKYGTTGGMSMGGDRGQGAFGGGRGMKGQMTEGTTQSVTE